MHRLRSHTNKRRVADPDISRDTLLASDVRRGRQRLRGPQYQTRHQDSAIHNSRGGGAV